MEQLKQLVEDFYNYTLDISITESELYSYYYEKLSTGTIAYLENQGSNNLNEELTRMIKADILYDFIYNIGKIKEQITNDIYCWENDSAEYKEIIFIYNQIKSVFKDFVIEDIENEEE